MFTSKLYVPWGAVVKAVRRGNLAGIMARRKLHDSPTVSWQPARASSGLFSRTLSARSLALPSLSFFDPESLLKSVYQLTSSTVRTGASVLMLIDLDSCRRNDWRLLDTVSYLRNVSHACGMRTSPTNGTTAPVADVQQFKLCLRKARCVMSS